MQKAAVLQSILLMMWVIVVKAWAESLLLFGLPSKCCNLADSESVTLLSQCYSIVNQFVIPLQFCTNSTQGADNK